MTQISVKELDQLLKKGDVFVLDVRERMELNNGTINSSYWIPMNDVLERLDEIPKDKKIVVYCRSGNRSEGIRLFLVEKGYEDVWNLEGGILAWKEIDDSVVEY